MKKLSVENPFFEFMGNLADLVLLNIVYLLTCIPVITIGTAQTALYKVMLKRRKKESSYPVREYFQAFRREWKQSVKSWMILLASGVILIVDVLYIGKEWNVWGVGVGVLLCLWIMIASYVFPLQAQFENTLKNIWKNAGLMAVRHFPSTIGIVLLNLLPLICFMAGSGIFGLTAPVFLVVGFALIARINVILFGRIFQYYM